MDKSVVTVTVPVVNVSDSYFALSKPVELVDESDECGDDIGDVDEEDGDTGSSSSSSSRFSSDFLPIGPFLWDFSDMKCSSCFLNGNLASIFISLGSTIYGDKLSLLGKETLLGFFTII